MRRLTLVGILLIILACLLLTLCLSLFIATGGISIIGPTPPISPSPTAVTGASHTPLTVSCPARQPAEESEVPQIGQETLALLFSTNIPARDPREIAARLGRTDGLVPEVVRSEPFNYQVGAIEKFWIQDEELSETYFQIDARLVYISEHAHWWVQEGEDFDERDIARAAQEFDTHIYPTVHQFFGEEWNPGVDSDPRINILNADLPSVGGYYSSADEYPQAVNPFSNQREMIYMSISNIPPSSRGYLPTLAHEFQHMVHWAVDANDDTWINEGSAELSSFLSGYPASVFSYPRQPDTAIMAWTDEIGEAGPYYEGAYLFMAYFAERFGADIVREFTAQAADGVEGFNATFEGRGIPLTFDEVFKDWVVANYLDDPNLAGGCFGYPSLDINVSRLSRISELPTTTEEKVNQYATDYYELRGLSGDVLIQFDGEDSTRVADTEPQNGSYVFWSNRGDVSDMTLTREFDLSGVDKATLTVQMWWDIELNYDYAYIEISADGGQTWEILDGRFTTAENPYGNNFRVGWTGKSGAGSNPGWVEERIDLTPYVGQEGLLRFEYITDDAFNRPGLLLDDIAIPEISYFEDFEDGDGGWEAAGFLRTDTLLPQRWAVQVIEFGETGVVIREMTLDASAQGELLLDGFGQGLDRAVLIISALAPSPNLPASYQFTVQQE
ncbi:MAG: immune inhibitor A [Chloroflexi bacterium]|nr:immune inhibitor A [Chloroflexota bacterium]